MALCNIHVFASNATYSYYITASDLNLLPILVTYVICDADALTFFCEQPSKRLTKCEIA